MERVFFKSDKSDTPVSVWTTADGKIDFRAVGRRLELEPDSIRLCGDTFPTNDNLCSEASWTQIKNGLREAGTEEDPVMVSGRPISEAPIDDGGVESSVVDLVSSVDDGDRICAVDNRFLMRPRIWLSFAGKAWLVAAEDDNGTICISRIAARTCLRPDSLTVGGVAIFEGITIEYIRSALGSTSGSVQELALPVDGDASPPGPAGLDRGMQIGHEIGELVPSDHPLSQFVACLQDSTLQGRILNSESNSVIELPQGIVWLGDEYNFSNQLFMRPCYSDLLEAKVEYFKLNSRLRAVVYTGTPGIGKSHLCALVVARKLIAGTVVFFERAVKSDKDVEERVVYRLDLATGVQRFKSSLVLDFVSRKDAVYIVDGCSASYPNAPVEIQIFASPSEELYRPERKGWRAYLYLHTPLFDLKELQSMRSAVSAFQKVIQGDVEEWFMAAGGVAWTVLYRAGLGNCVQDWKAEAPNLISNMEKGHIEKAFRGLEEGVFSLGSDTLFHSSVDEIYVEGNGKEKSKKRKRQVEGKEEEKKEAGGRGDSPERFIIVMRRQ